MKTKPHRSIAAGLANPENDVDQRRGYRAGSFVSQLAELEVGETASRAKAIDDRMNLAKLREALPELRQEMRNGINKSVQRAKEDSSREYRLEVFDTQTMDRNWFLIALITRTA